MRNRGLVKTVRFGSPKYVGDPVNAVRIFNEKEADELIALDIDATVERREPDFRIISQIASECRMPLCYGGGIKTVDQAKRIISAGVEKVAISSGTFDSLDLGASIAGAIGSHSVVFVFDVRKTANGSYSVWTHNAQRDRHTGLSAMLRYAEDCGAGEVVINSIDADGTMQGYDLALGQMVRDSSTLPMTMLGGAGSLADIKTLLAVCGVIGAAAGSLFVFKGPHRAVLINYPSAAQKDEVVHSLSSSSDRQSHRPSAHLQS